MTDRSPRAQAPKSVLAPLVCLECQQEADPSARGWRAYLGGGYEGEPLEVGVYCPDCAAREFGDD